MSNPFLIEGPASVSFSGGRTSGLMLHRILEAHGGRLPDDVLVTFANTGKERSETLDFVEECARQWSVPIHWLEHRPRTELDAAKAAHFIAVFADHGIALDATRFAAVPCGFVEVDHATASCNGEPFVALIIERNFLPNPVTRFCTQEMKLRPMKRWLQARGLVDWTSAVGLRFDEPRRVARMRAPRKEAYDVALPLADARITLADVDAFWAGQSFRLNLRQWEGNCDLCYLKGQAKRRRIMFDSPASPQWWIAAETALETARTDDARFRHDTPSYARMADTVRRQVMLPMLIDSDDPTDLGDCVCTD